MTVAELIEKLETLPKDLIVVDGGGEPMEIGNVMIVNVDGMAAVVIE